MPIYKKPTKRQAERAAKQHLHWAGFPADGLWLVKTTPNVRSYARIDKVAELPNTPFPRLAVEADDLMKMLYDLDERAKKKTGVYKQLGYGHPKELVSWTPPTRQDTAMAILHWLATKEAK